MRRAFHHIFKGLLIALMLALVPGASAFSLLGPRKAYQASGFGGLPGGLGYNLTGDIGGPMGLNEPYRWNVPDLYYACDGSFLQYFGVRGAQAVDEAFVLLNSLPPASSINVNDYSQTDMLRENQTARAVGLLDLKSRTLEMMMEQLGLVNPVRFVWTLRDRSVVTVGGVSQTNYLVTKLNFDPVTLAPTSVVNGSTYTYRVAEPLRPGDYADAEEALADQVRFGNGNPTTMAQGALASDFNFGFGVGLFWIGLTRDDIGGLRYLYRTNNFRTESILTGSLVAITNRTAFQVLTNQDLETFRLRTTLTTNDPATLTRLYPGLVITGSNAVPRVVFETNVFVTFTNSAPFSNSSLFVTNFTTNIVALWNYQITDFGNVITNSTNGSFYLLPSNLYGYEFIGDLLSTVTPVTNFLPNLTFFTNGLPNTNVQLVLSNQDLLTFQMRVSRTTNDIATVLAFYPGLVITNTSSALALVIQTNLVQTFTNNIPLVSTNINLTNFNTYATVTNLTTNILTLFDYAVANVVTNVNLQGIYIVPTNQLGFQFVSTLLTNVVTITNLGFGSVTLTNGFINTNNVQVVTNRDLNTFIRDTGNGTTLSPTQLVVLYPGLIITNFSFLPDISVQTNVNVVITNILGMPTNIVVTNVFTNILTRYFYTNGLANVFTNLGDRSIFVLPTNLLGYLFLTNLLTTTNVVTNVNAEVTAGFFINSNSPLALTTIDLLTFHETVRTNAPNQVRALFPDLLILATNSVTIGTAQATNFTFFLTNSPFAPVGTPPTVVFVPVVTNYLVTNYSYTFGNVVTNSLFTTGFVTSQRVEVYPPPFAPVGSGVLVTNVINQTVAQSLTNGSLYFIPTNLVGYQLVSALLTTVVTTTNTNTVQLFLSLSNVTGLATNATLAFTNEARLTYATNFTFAVYPIEFLFGTNRNETYSFFTNALYVAYPVESRVVATNFLTHQFTNVFSAVYPVVAQVFGTNQLMITNVFTNVTSAVYPIEFQPPTSSIGIRPGVEKLRFHKTTFDSLIGQAFQTLTNTYTNYIVTNFVALQQVVRRVVTRPDILLLSEDLGVDNQSFPFIYNRTGTANWINNDALNGNSNQGGPGVITPPIRLTFTDLLPYYRNEQPFFLDEASATVLGNFIFPVQAWGSFDGTTNTPVVYPDYISIQDLENEVLNPPSP